MGTDSTTLILKRDVAAGRKIRQWKASIVAVLLLGGGANAGGAEGSGDEAAHLWHR